ncbi:MAG TPA: hypothetical protein VNQ81_05385 [Povalibacter sp.]|nr:hypothetical protein [Povalibacter sp.]
MKTRHRRAVTEGVTFRSLVRDCAEEPEIVESFNKAYNAHLKAPIKALLQDRWPMSVSTEEEMHLGCFIVFVHENIWLRLKRVQTKLGVEPLPPSSR